MNTKRTIGFSLVFVALAAIAGTLMLSNSLSGPASPDSVPTGSDAAASDLPSDATIRKAQRMIRTWPKNADAYNLLAVGFMQKARETGDFGFNAQAETALLRSREIEPDNFGALRLGAALHVVYHRFEEGLVLARRAASIRPDNPDVYGTMSDALVELGRYDEAVDATQAMMDLRPDAASYSRVAHLRALHGDLDGALDAMATAVRTSDAADREKHAWFYTYLGKYLVDAGKRAEAELAFDRALASFPDYHLALAAKAHARASAGDFDQAVDLYHRSLARVPQSDVAIALGRLYRRLGREADARRQFDLADAVERTGADPNATPTRAVLLQWADDPERLDMALDAARRARAERADVATSDALAWCLFRKGRLAEAKAAIDEARRLDTPDPLMTFHAGMIAEALGDRTAAARFLRQVLEIDPNFDPLAAEVARETLTKLA
jgi:tetratricopeptide (TPR) repeat protein